MVPIPDITVITLTLAMIKKTGLKWTVPLFKSEFILGNKERIRRLTAGDAGFHGAHSAVTATPPSYNAITIAAVTPSPAPPAAARHVTVEGGKIFYCWTHGLSRHSKHTSLTCLHKAEGHQDNATAFRMKGGNNTIASGRPRQLSTTTSSDAN